MVWLDSVARRHCFLLGDRGWGELGQGVEAVYKMWSG